MLITAAVASYPSYLVANENSTIDRTTIGWITKESLSTEEASKLPSFCSGRYQIPDIKPILGGQIIIEADTMTSGIALNSIADTRLDGRVELFQEDRIVRSDTLVLDNKTKNAQLLGDVSIHSPETNLFGDSAFLQQEPFQFTVDNVFYTLPTRHIRGSASSVNSPTNNRLELHDATFTFCEPGRNDWDIAASSLHLDQEAGMGSAWNTRLRIANVPVLYLPYYRFPIDDRRLTGFLDPKFSINGKGQAEDIQLPFYLNIAPNIDATFTPHFIRDRGVVAENQIRYKGRFSGDHELNYDYLHEDETTLEERSFLNYQLNGSWAEHWNHQVTYNRVSDKDYLNEMSPSASVDRTSHLPRRASINYTNAKFTASVLAESFQTIDELIPLGSRPYRRLPQTTVTYSKKDYSGWQFETRTQHTRFGRKIEDEINGNTQRLSGLAAIEADRIVFDNLIGYRWSYPFGFFQPSVDVRARQYQYDNLDQDQLDFSDSEGFESGRLRLDGNLIFERDLNWFDMPYLQTFEPRILYSLSTYDEEQQGLPTFDTIDTPVTFASLFSGDRFIGDDRLADLNQLSLGATSRFIRDDGSETLRLSAGQIFYFDDREVNLSNSLPVATSNQSSVLGEFEWMPLDRTYLFSTIEWDTDEQFTKQSRFGFRYQSLANRFLDISSTQTKQFDASTDEIDVVTKQIDGGFFWALNDSWAVLGRQLHDLKQYDDNEAQPEDSVLEALAGIEYQSCCWRVQLSYRESSPRSSDDPLITTEKDYSFLLSFELKGLGNFGGDVDELLTEAVPSYARREYHTH